MKLGVLAVFVFSLAIGMAWAGPAGEQGTAAATARPRMTSGPSMIRRIKVTSVFALSAFIEDALAQKPDVMEDNVWTRGYRDDLGIETELLWTVPSAQFDESSALR